MNDIEKWLKTTDFSNLELIEKDTLCVYNGVAVIVREDSFVFCDTVTQYLILPEHGDRCLKRTGTKEYSYDHWVDTWWQDWEPNN